MHKKAARRSIRAHDFTCFSVEPNGLEVAQANDERESGHEKGGGTVASLPLAPIGALAQKAKDVAAGVAAAVVVALAFTVSGAVTGCYWRQCH